MKKLIWDIPTRLFHWILVIVICSAAYTGLDGGFEIMDYHMWLGYTVLGLVTFRILWGFVGGRYARFAQFIKGPSAIKTHLQELKTDPAKPHAGHNPLGALSVVAILLLLLTQTGTGLFANDEVFFEGPLVHLIDYDLSNQLTEIHELNFWILCGLVGLHVLAIIFYEARGQRLVKAMVTGYQTLAAEVEETSHRLIVAVIAAAVSAGGVYYLVNYV